MNTNALSETFQINIPLTAHVQAEKFRRGQSQGHKAKEVYLNTLAVSVANSYLNMIGWSTSLEHSDCWNPIFQTMMNVADLQIPSYGKLECRAVLRGESNVIIPPEVWSARIGYLVVMLDQNLKQGQLLGFVRQVKQLELPLQQLEPLSNFPVYLSQQKRIQSTAIAALSRWIEGGVDSGWQRLNEFAPSVAINFRSKQELAQLPDTDVSQSRVKLISLGEDGEHTVILILNIQSLDRSEFNVSVKVSNYQYNKYLPEGLELVIVDRASIPVMIAQANQTETIEFCFSGELEENFSVEISLDEHFVVENFII